MGSTASVQFVDKLGLKTTMKIEPIPDAFAVDMNKVKALASSLRSYVNAGLVGCALQQRIETYVTDNYATPTGTNAEKLLALYHWINDDNVTVYGQLWLPNPSISNFEAIDGVGYRLKVAALDFLSAAYSTCTGRTMTVYEGRREYREVAPGISAKASDNCLRFVDESKNECFMSVPLAASKEQLTAFGVALNKGNGAEVLGFTMSCCNRSYFLQKAEYLYDPTVSPGLPDDAAWGSIETRANVKMRYLQDDKRKFMKIGLPAVKQANCEVKQGKKGWGLKKAVGQGVALALTAFFGATNRTCAYVNAKVDVTQYDPQG